MSDEIPEPNPPLTPDEEAAAQRLTSEELSLMDSTILKCCRRDWQKLAMVCSRVHEQLARHFPMFSYSVYVDRIGLLADQGLLEASGDLDYMRFSEVRLLNQS